MKGKSLFKSWVVLGHEQALPVEESDRVLGYRLAYVRLSLSLHRGPTFLSLLKRPRIQVVKGSLNTWGNVRKGTLKLTMSQSG